MDIADARADFIFQVDAGVGNLVTDQIEGKRRAYAFTSDGDLHVRALGALQHVGYFIGTKICRGLAIDGDDDVAGVDVRAEGRSVLKRIDDDDFAVLRLYDHADAVVLGVLVFPHAGVRFGVVEIPVGIERAQHAGDGDVVDRLVRHLAG